MTAQAHGAPMRDSAQPEAKSGSLGWTGVSPHSPHGTLSSHASPLKASPQSQV